MPRPFNYQIPHLNMLLGAFESLGVGKWATIQDVVVRSNIRLDVTEAETLAQYLLTDGYIKESLKVKGYNLAQVPGTGMVDIPYGDAGYELTPKGKQFHIDGGYRLEKIRPLAKHAVTPITKPANKKQKPLTKFATWREENPGTVVILGGLFAIALVVLGVWLTFNWNNITVSSFKSLFGLSP